MIMPFLVGSKSMSVNSLFPRLLPAAGESEPYLNTTPKLYGDRPVYSTTRQSRTGLDEAARNRLSCDAVKVVPLVKRRYRVRHDPSLLRT